VLCLFASLNCVSITPELIQVGGTVRTILMFLSGVILLSGCALDPSDPPPPAPPSKAQLASADYGSYPSDYKNVIETYMDQELKDPESARYDYLNQPVRAWNNWEGLKFGYAVCVNINAKNSFGGYSGASPYYFLIYNQQVVTDIGGDYDYEAENAVSACKQTLKI